jgi:hypothetical protein
MIAALLLFTLPAQADAYPPRAVTISPESPGAGTFAPVVNLGTARNMPQSFAVRLVPSDQPGEQAIDTVVVVPRCFLAALQPWLNHRAAQGHRMLIVDPQMGSTGIRVAIRDIAGGGRLKYVVLVGDAEPTAHLNPIVHARHTPTFQAAAHVNVRWGSEPEIATDNPFADLDDDLIPDVAVGRISANTVTDLRQIIDKILRYERQPRIGEWQRRVNFVAGVGGFGALADAVVETTCKRIITNGIRPEYDISMTYGSWRSPYCPDPRKFRDVTIRRLNEGSLFWVYIGHGRLGSLDRIQVPNGDLPIFEASDIGKLNCGQGLPIALMLSCYTGAFDHARDCLGEEMLLAPRGPIAVIAGSRVTMPYAMAVFGTGMLDGFFGGNCATVGDLFLYGKRHLATSRSDPIISRKLLDSLARAIHPTKDDVDAERMEHLLLFNLIGDPLLRIPYPRDVRVNAPQRATAGTSIVVEGQSSIPGDAAVELVCRRDRMRLRTGRRLRYDDSEGALARMSQVYEFANERRWNSRQVQITGGRFRVRLPIPNEAQGPSHVRVMVQGQDSFALGASDIYIQPPLDVAEAAK